MDAEQAIEAFAEVCFAHSVERIAALQTAGKKFAHYTTASNAKLILEGKRLWLRNAALMNDFSEITHGLGCLRYVADKTDLLKRLHDAVEAVHPGIAGEAYNLFATTENAVRNLTYMTSVCEHDPDDEFGRLSMWRAYGGDTAGVALVFNPDFLDEDSGALDAYTSPVLYGGPNEFAGEFAKMVVGVEANKELMASVPADNVRLGLLHALRFAVLSTKHKGFAEEQEWRVLHSPHDGSSEIMPPCVESVAGIPQVVHKLPLENLDGMDMQSVNLPTLLHRVIIGPSAYPHQIALAFAKILYEDCGIEDPWARIRVSEIPLRRVG